MSSRSPDPEAQLVGRQIRSLRRSASLTMVELAAKARVSQPFLSQIERGLAAPSLTTILSLAEALGVQPGQLLGPPARDGSVAHEATPKVMQAHERAFDTVLIHTPGSDVSRLEAYEHVFNPGEPPRDWFQHEGEDFVYVLEGTVELQLLGEKAVLLEGGRSAVYPGRVPHRCVVAGPARARTLVVVSGHVVTA
ncbi:MAG: helix-turn-helix domain-containing protein [Acidimicrobiales bacterium]